MARAGEVLYPRWRGGAAGRGRVAESTVRRICRISAETRRDATRRAMWRLAGSARDARHRQPASQGCALEASCLPTGRSPAEADERSRVSLGWPEAIEGPAEQAVRPTPPSSPRGPQVGLADR